MRTTMTLIAAAVLAVLTVVGTLGITSIGSHDVTVPDTHGQASSDAIATLQNGGFKTRVRHSADPTVPPGRVIDTNPDVNTAVSADEEITLNVSTGPGGSDVPDVSTGTAKLTVPDVSSLTYADAVRTLTDVGFGRFQQAFLPSSPEQKDRVLITNPTANRTIAITSEITIVLGSGPMAAVP